MDGMCLKVIFQKTSFIGELKIFCRKHKEKEYTSMGSRPVVLIVCTGLGKINRGYETFTRECFDTLKEADTLDIYLLKGAGKKEEHEIVAPNLHRRSKVAQWLGKLIRQDGYYVEQLTFCISLLPVIVAKKPSVIYYSDFILGTFLWKLRRFFKFKYKLLFANGAPNGPPFTRMDHVQQLLPVHFEVGIKGGTPASMQTLLPYGFRFRRFAPEANNNNKAAIRKRLGLPENKKIIISVGALNMRQKRMDYIVNEMVALQEEYFLIMLGQADTETPVLLQIAEQKLKTNYKALTVSPDELQYYYQAADYFVLASLHEGFGRVFPEAMSCGLPCFVHDYRVAREVLGPYGQYFQANNPGALIEALQTFDHRNDFSVDRMIEYTHHNYSWQSLAPAYIAMIKNVAE
ncbi:MAG: glycosyltransferase [Chitinophagaceae bacterium]